MRDAFGNINYWAVLVSAILYWVIGMLWFSFIVGKDWAVEMNKHGIKIHRPTTAKMIEKSVWTFILNLIVSFGIAILVNGLGIHTFGSAIGLGLVIGICFAVAPMINGYLWEDRSFKLSFYDVFYPFISILIASIIITLWR